MNNNRARSDEVHLHRIDSVDRLQHLGHDLATGVVLHSCDQKHCPSIEWFHSVLA
jgi:hypothetical protein